MFISEKVNNYNRLFVPIAFLTPKLSRVIIFSLRISIICQGKSCQDQQSHKLKYIALMINHQILKCDLNRLKLNKL